MSFKNISQLFMVGFLGLALVGCSSTPTSEESGDTAGTSETKTEATKQVEVDVEAAKRAAAAKLAEELAELKATIDGKTVQFEFDRYEIASEYFPLIKANADYLSMKPETSITIGGHCDERGTREYNLALGERRAMAVKNALVAEGVSPSRINIVSYGEDSPVDEAHTEAAWSKNRRAEFVY